MDCRKNTPRLKDLQAPPGLARVALAAGRGASDMLAFAGLKMQQLLGGKSQSATMLQIRLASQMCSMPEESQMCSMPEELVLSNPNRSSTSRSSPLGVESGPSKRQAQGKGGPQWNQRHCGEDPGLPKRRSPDLHLAPLGKRETG